MTSSARAAILRDAAQGARLLRMTDYCAAALYEKRRGKLSVPRTLRGAISAFTRVFNALWLAAWCAAERGSRTVEEVGPGSAEQRKRAAPRPGHGASILRLAERRPERMAGIDPDNPELTREEF
jgi:hypothetical protein